MLYFISQPGFGIYPYDERDCSAIGSIGVSPRRTKTEGWWCPHCLKEGMYEWMTSYKCGVCKNISSMYDEEVKQLMKDR